SITDESLEDDSANRCQEEPRPASERIAAHASSRKQTSVAKTRFARIRLLPRSFVQIPVRSAQFGRSACEVSAYRGGSGLLVLALDRLFSGGHPFAFRRGLAVAARLRAGTVSARR